MSEPAPPPARTLDLRGVGCPLNYVKTRVALDAVVPEWNPQARARSCRGKRIERVAIGRSHQRTADRFILIGARKQRDRLGFRVGDDCRKLR